MDTFLLRLHQLQIEHQCRAGLFALDIAQQGLDQGDQQVFWASVQNVLTAAANISKTLWGQGGKLAGQREPIRASLGVADDNALASTYLRNHLEHFDERLDRWYETSERRNHVDFVIGPAESSVVGVEPTDTFRHFDPETGDVIFWGEHHSLISLRDAFTALLPVVSAEARKPHWEI